ncbi:Uncharacterised protein [Mycobacteroides abscessus subsp. abscessus]|nr:Uncharacterised protein [Mycobacteroides abscessus subsp. abscessus]SKU02693.1 Uncharacterised protein [Mycobacteroides abscessus subsp. abscessus]SKV84736.1 Uncharacterised protein [Mycobacteroides abscessus subsp. abscessus]
MTAAVSVTSQGSARTLAPVLRRMASRRPVTASVSPERLINVIWRVPIRA